MWPAQQKSEITLEIPIYLFLIYGLLFYPIVVRCLERNRLDKVSIRPSLKIHMKIDPLFQQQDEAVSTLAGRFVANQV